MQSSQGQQPAITSYGGFPIQEPYPGPEMTTEAILFIMLLLAFVLGLRWTRRRPKK